MLEELSIRNFAIVDRLSVRFCPGLNVLSGETGAGKSILIGALGFLLGAKADTGIIRSGADECLVSGMIHVGSNIDALAWLEGRGIEPEDGLLVIRRSLKRTGRGSLHIQNIPSLRQDMIELASLLLEVHGQRDGQALLRRERQRLILDRYAGIEDEVQAYGRVYQALVAKRKTMESLAGSAVERAREIEFLRYAVTEITDARLVAGEEEALTEEERLLSQYEKMFSALTQARDLLGDADGAVARLRKARLQLETASGIDSRLSEFGKRIDDAYYEIEDVCEALGSHADQLSFDPGRLEVIESRLAELQKLKRKYGPALADVIRYRDESSTRLVGLENWEEDRESLSREIAELESEVHTRAESISEARTRAGEGLARSVAAIMATLGMPAARFAVRLERKPLVDGKVVVGPFGADEPEFHVSANKGEPLRPIVDVASGGELSRVMLAIKTVLAKADGVPAMVFDEIDTGIGGEVALSVGGHLSALAEGRQVLCITHLASIAVRADNHIKVEKLIDGERTVTKVTTLHGDDRVREIARMLSGDADSKTSTDHAADLIRKHGRGS
jgi:DNA repair protein RecN (Recombination protein N)